MAIAPVALCAPAEPAPTVRQKEDPPKRIVEVLHMDGCDNGPQAIARIKVLAKDLNVTVDIRETKVKDDAHAVALKFAGSPTIRINGIDIEPAARKRTSFALT